MQQDQETLEFRLAKRYRIAAVYLFLAVLLVSPALRRLAPDALRDPLFRDMALYGYILAVVFTAFGAWWAYHWQIIIDSHGVHRRTLFLWRHWPWWLFEQGNVRRGLTYFSFKLPGRESYKNTIDFGSLEKDDAHRALDLCYAHWAQPPRRPLPDKVIFSAVPTLTGKGRAHTVKFTAEGVWVDKKKGHPTNQWGEVSKVVLVKPSREHENCTLVSFKVAEMRLFFMLTRAGESGLLAAPSWQVAGYLETYVPAAQITVCTDDPPETLAELDEQVYLLRERLRGKNVWSALGGAGSLFTFIGNVHFHSFKDAFMNFVTAAVAVGTAIYFVHTHLQHRRKLKDLEALRTQLTQ